MFKDGALSFSDGNAKGEKKGLTMHCSEWSLQAPWAKSDKRRKWVWRQTHGDCATIRSPKAMAAKHSALQ